MARGKIQTQILNAKDNKVLSHLHTHFGADNYELRFVLDMGSGNTKTNKVLFNKSTNKIEKVLSFLRIPISYQKELMKSASKKNLSDEFIEDIKSIYSKTLEANSVDCSKIKCMGYATAWSRNAELTDLSKALNALQSINIFVKPVTHKKEGEVGYKAANSALSAEQQKTSIIWDIGGESFQLSGRDKNKDFQMCGSNQFGSQSFIANVKKSYKSLFKKDLIENQILLKDEIIDIINDIDKSDLTNVQNCINSAGLDIQNKNTYGIEGFMNFGIKPLFKKDKVSQTEIQDMYNNQSDYEKAFKNSGINPKAADIQMTQTNLILLDLIMQSSGIQEINFLMGSQSSLTIAQEDVWSQDHSYFACNDSSTCFLD